MVTVNTKADDESSIKLNQMHQTRIKDDAFRASLCLFLFAYLATVYVAWAVFRQ